MSISFHGEKIIFISPIKLFAAFEARAVFPVQSLKTVKSFLQSGNLCEGGFVAWQGGIFTAAFIFISIYFFWGGAQMTDFT